MSRHATHNWPLRFDLNVSNSEGHQGGESEFQVLLWALTQYKEDRLELMEKWRFERVEESDKEPDEYTMHAETLSVIDELLASLAHGLCLADHQRVQSLEVKKPDATPADSQPSQNNGLGDASQQVAWWKDQNARLLDNLETLVQLLKQRGGPTDEGQ